MPVLLVEDSSYSMLSLLLLMLLAVMLLDLHREVFIKSQTNWNSTLVIWCLTLDCCRVNRCSDLFCKGIGTECFCLSRFVK